MQYGKGRILLLQQRRLLPEGLDMGICRRAQALLQDVQLSLAVLQNLGLDGIFRLPAGIVLDVNRRPVPIQPVMIGLLRLGRQNTEIRRCQSAEGSRQKQRADPGILLADRRHVRICIEAKGHFQRRQRIKALQLPLWMPCRKVLFHGRKLVKCRIIDIIIIETAGQTLHIVVVLQSQHQTAAGIQTILQSRQHCRETFTEKMHRPLRQPGHHDIMIQSLPGLRIHLLYPALQQMEKILPGRVLCQQQKLRVLGKARCRILEMDPVQEIGSMLAKTHASCLSRVTSDSIS